MRIRAGYQISFRCSKPTPMMLMLSVAPDRLPDLLSPHEMHLSPSVPAKDYRDLFGNTCTRLVAPTGLLEIRNEFTIRDSGLPDAVDPSARQLDVSDLPDETLSFLLASRYCDTEKLSDLAWTLFGGMSPGWPRVQAICDYTHDRIVFGY